MKIHLETSPCLTVTEKEGSMNCPYCHGELTHGVLHDCRAEALGLADELAALIVNTRLPVPHRNDCAPCDRCVAAARAYRNARGLAHA